RTGIVACSRRLDLDHARAQFGHQQRAVGSRKYARQVDDQNVAEGSFRSHRWPVRDSHAVRTIADSFGGIELLRIRVAAELFLLCPGALPRPLRYSVAGTPRVR